MALHVEIPTVPDGRDSDGTDDVTRPPHSLPPRLDCSRDDWRQANDYVRTPCLLTPADPAQQCAVVTYAPKGCVRYSAESTPGHLVFAEVPSSLDLKEPEIRLPAKENGGGNGASTSAYDYTCGRPANRCPRCRQCMCDKCRRPRDLPRYCAGTCETVVDWLTCLCCVRGVFYHCCEGAEEENDYADHPCGCCDYPRCFARWLFIVVITLFLPCLVLYLPFRGVLELATCCYNGPCFRGCRCDRVLPASRPLIEAENSSV